MKIRFLLLSFLFVMTSLYVCGQDQVGATSNGNSNNFLPIINSDQTWVGATRGFAPARPFQYTYAKDSVLVETKYYYGRINSNAEDGSSPFVFGYFKEVGGKLIRKLDGNFNEEVILDMSLMVGDTFEADYIIDNQLVVVAVDTVTYSDDVPRKRIELKCVDRSSDYGSIYWVEGIGELYGGLLCAVDGVDYVLRCVLDEDGNRIYSRHAESEVCWIPTSTTEVGSIDFGVIPNPAHRLIAVETDEQVLSIEVLGVDGAKLLTTQNTSQVDVGGLSSGLYFLKVYTKDGVGTKPFVKR